ncbi:MAG: phosphomannomutase/phosphoglucomutase [Candidatus Poribacteria bacterium]|nr:phosphomannomutase/phosphoglucomutase [Candidatus Poribacteria bacterium]
MNSNIFRAYDIRGIFGIDFQPKDFYRIARAYADRFQPQTVALGHDVRESSPQLWKQAGDGLQDAGVDVLNLGQISTDMLYFAVARYQTDGGITISASHNPAPYNGMKLVRGHALPISSDTGLFDVRDAIKSDCRFEKQDTCKRGTLQTRPFLDAYLVHLRSFVDLQQLSEKRIVINANSGLAGQVAERLLAETPIQVCARLFIDPDGTFAQIPAGRPDPLRPENRGLTIQAVQQTGADLAVAWDADADRCFFFDEEGEFVEGCYITALLAEHLLQKKGNGIIIFDPRAVWAVEAAVKTANGTPILNRCGHSFIKTRMQETDALFAGEASGHYYFRDNFYADNGMIPLLLMLEHLSATKISLAESVNRFRTNYPVSGEINFAFESRDHILNTIEAVRHALCCWGNHPCIEIPVDGLSVRFFANSRSHALEDLGLGSWRFNLRESNTEPLLRLNVEAVGCEELLVEKTEMLNGMLTKFGGKRDTKFRWEIGDV